MKIVGVIVEYNPLHNGHVYHINEIKKLAKPDLIVAVMSSSFTMRGDLSIYDKFTKTKQALNNGIDIVIELPLALAMHRADIFAKNAINTNALDRLDSEKIYLIMVDDRVCPPNRYNIDSLLMSYGLRVYDQWELLKRTYGMNVNDCIWMSEKKIDASWFWSRHPRSRYTSREKIDDYREKHGYPRKYGSLKQ